MNNLIQQISIGDTGNNLVQKFNYNCNMLVQHVSALKSDALQQEQALNRLDGIVFNQGSAITELQKINKKFSQIIYVDTDSIEDLGNNQYSYYVDINFKTSLAWKFFTQQTLNGYYLEPIVLDSYYDMNTKKIYFYIDQPNILLVTSSPYLIIEVYYDE